MFHNKGQGKAGFTMLEILLVVAMIAILAGIVIFAINPGKQLAEARNSQRRVDVNTILNAIYQYSIDNNGVIPTQIGAIPVEICTSVSGADCSGRIDLTALVTDEKYLVALPVDPQCTGAYSTCYTVLKSANNRVTVTAVEAELGATISVTR
jgi:prepilin-type N-terminal cleavage/methylation domain-containing protein